MVAGYWDCPYCKTKKNSGAKRECTNCGHPRSDNTKFYMNTSVPINYVDTKDEDHIRKLGPDWKCKFCNTLNSDTEDVCQSCGHSRDEDADTYFDTEEDIKEEEINTTYESKPLYHNKEPTVEPKPAMKLKKKISLPLVDIDFRKIAIIFGNILVAAGITVLALWLFLPHEEQFMVQDKYWTRTIDIEESRTVRESDWTIPSGGRLAYTREEIHHYDKVVDHYEKVSVQVVDHYETVVDRYEDKGNGYFEEHTHQEPVYTTSYSISAVYRDEPVYQLKYYYDIDRWFYSRSVSSSGCNDTPYWPTVTFGIKERERTRTTNCTASGIVNEEESKTYTFEEHDWNRLRKDETITILANRAGFAEIKKE